MMFYQEVTENQNFSNEENLEIKEYEWLYRYVCKGRAHDRISYRKLFTYLHRTEFIFSIPNDVNRAKDGVDLRYRFVTSLVIPDEERILDILDGPCSVLEMMIALAIRCEETIMDDTRYGDRTGQWFWNMMANLGIGNMTDEGFDIKKVSLIINKFLDRDYDYDGKGGLFYIKGCEDDLRNVEIWTQLCWYLDNI